MNLGRDSIRDFIMYEMLEDELAQEKKKREEKDLPEADASDYKCLSNENE